MSYLMHKYDKTLPRKKVLLQEPFFIHKIICLIYNNLVNIFTKFYFWNIMYLSGCSTLPNKKIKYLFCERGSAPSKNSIFGISYIYRDVALCRTKKIEYLFCERGSAPSKNSIFGILYIYRDVAQLGSALRSGRRGRRFKSCHPDHLKELRFLFFYWMPGLHPEHARNFYAFAKN